MSIVPVKSDVGGVTHVKSTKNECNLNYTYVKLIKLDVGGAKHLLNSESLLLSRLQCCLVTSACYQATTMLP